MGPHLQPARCGLRGPGHRLHQHCRTVRCRWTGTPPEQRNQRRPFTGHGDFPRPAVPCEFDTRASQGAHARAGPALGRTGLLARHCEKWLALDARLPAGLGRSETRHSRRNCQCRPRISGFFQNTDAHLQRQRCGDPLLPAAGLPAGLLAVDPDAAPGEHPDDSGAGAILDLGAGALCGLDCAVADQWRDQPIFPGPGPDHRAAAAAVQPGWRHHCHGAHPAAVHDLAAVQRDEICAPHLFTGCRVAGQLTSGCVFPGLHATNFSGYGRRRSAGIHSEHWLLRDTGAAGRA